MFVRKPETGLGEMAINKCRIATSRSFMIEDSKKDMEFGKRLGADRCR